MPDRIRGDRNGKINVFKPEKLLRISSVNVTKSAGN